MRLLPLTLLGFLLATVLTGQAKEVKLKTSTLRVAAELPLRVRHVIEDHLPEELVGKGYSVAVRDGDLEIDTTGDGRHDTKVKGTKTAKLTIGKTPSRTILVFKVLEKWFVGAAACLVGSYRRRAISLLDADLDGRFDGPEDYVRFGHGSFHQQHPNRLLAEDDLLLRYEVDAEKPAVRITAIRKPGQYNILQWRALAAANHVRSQVGIPPLELNPKRSDACQKHAKYLLLNNYDYSKPWDGVGSHAEKPGNPGYTEEGHEAARTHMTSGSGDAAGAIIGQMQTMLHRTGYLGPVKRGLGVGAVDECHNNSASGYSVVGIGRPKVSDVGDIVVVPAPGQRGVLRYCRRERPIPDRDPSFYEKGRGFPISVSHGGLLVSKSGIQVFAVQGKKLRPVSGSVFSPERPVSRTRRSNNDSTIFVADNPLSPKTTYVARFRAKSGGTPIDLAWRFTTQ